MATHCQMAMQSRSGECQTIRAVNSLKGKKGSGQLQTKYRYLIRVVTCNVSLYFVKYIIFIT